MPLRHSTINVAGPAFLLLLCCLALCGFSTQAAESPPLRRVEGNNFSIFLIHTPRNEQGTVLRPLLEKAITSVQFKGMVVSAYDASGSAAANASPGQGQENTGDLSRKFSDMFDETRNLLGSDTVFLLFGILFGLTAFALPVLALRGKSRKRGRTETDRGRIAPASGLRTSAVPVIESRDRRERPVIINRGRR